MDPQKNQQTQAPVAESCRKKKSDDASFLQDVRDHIDEFVHASMDEHKLCFKKTMQKMFGMSKAISERNSKARTDDDGSHALSAGTSD